MTIDSEKASLHNPAIGCQYYLIQCSFGLLLTGTSHPGPNPGPHILSQKPGSSECTLPQCSGQPLISKYLAQDAHGHEKEDHIH